MLVNQNVFDYCPQPEWLANLPEVAKDYSLAIKSHDVSRCNLLYAEAVQALSAKDYHRALSKIRQVIGLNAYLAPAYCLLGDVFYFLEKYPEAEKAYRRSISFDLDNLKTLIAFGNLLNHLNRFAEAAEIFQRTIQIDANIVSGRVNYGMTLMNMGKFQDGWPAYDLRIDHYDKVVGIAEKIPSYNQRWQGENLAGKSILIWSEQGIGDEILFARFVLMLAEQNPVQIVWATVGNLSKLFQCFKDKVPQLLLMSHRAFLNLPESEQKRINYWSALLSLPRFCCAADPLQFPRNLPYIYPSQETISKWKAQIDGKSDNSKTINGSVFAEATKLKVGLVWRGQTVNPIGMYRSAPNGLKDFALLFQLKNIKFYSLQKQLNSDDTELIPGLALSHLMDKVHDMDDTAGIIANLDLVISIDTSVGHLAGAMGKACWIIHSGYGAEWRHFDGQMKHLGSDSFWYPKVHRYFRGKANPKNWQQLIHQVYLALAKLSQAENFPSLPFPDSGTIAESRLPEIVRRCYQLERQGDLIGAFNFAKDNIIQAPDDLVLVRLIADYAYSLEWLEQAETWFNYEFSLDRSSVPRMVRFSRVYQGLRRNEEAIRLLRYALTLEPENESVRLCLAEHLLSAGEFTEGWARYLIRHDLTYLPRIPFPKWKGESLKGRSIFLSTEQGMGDEIQFVRFVAELKRVGCARVTVMCKLPLVEIFRNVKDIDLVVPFESGTLLEWHDFWSFPLDLPHYLQTSYENLPASIPYLSVEKSFRDKWQAIFAKQNPDDFRVGLVWKGNPLHTNDIRRSMKHFSQLQALWQVSNVSFFSLQKGEAESEINPAAVNQTITALGHLINDFRDTAAIAEQLDLLICVDTSVTHLFGALGKAAWVFVPMFEYDWRWGEQCKFTGVNPWYPSIKTINKPAATSWEVVIDSLVAPLAKLVLAKKFGKENEFNPNVEHLHIPAETANFLELSRQQIISYCNRQKYGIASQLCLHIINYTRNSLAKDPVNFLLLSQIFNLMQQDRAALEATQEYLRIVQQNYFINSPAAVGTNENNLTSAPINKLAASLANNFHNVPSTLLREYALAVFALDNFELALPVLQYLLQQAAKEDWQCFNALLLCQFYIYGESEQLNQQFAELLNFKAQQLKVANPAKPIALAAKKPFSNVKPGRNCLVMRLNSRHNLQHITENIRAAKYLLGEWHCLIYCSPEIETSDIVALIRQGAAVVKLETNSTNMLLGEYAVLEQQNIDYFFMLGETGKINKQSAQLISRGVANSARFFLKRSSTDRGFLCPLTAWGGQNGIIKNIAQLLNDFASENILTRENLQIFNDSYIWPQIAASLWIDNY